MAEKKRMRLEMLPLWNIHVTRQRDELGSLKIPLYLLEDIRYFPNMVIYDDPDAMRVYLQLMEQYFRNENSKFAVNLLEYAAFLPIERYLVEGEAIFHVFSAIERLERDYELIRKELGHHPTTTELQLESRWRRVWARIETAWGTISAFREELSIPKPPQGNPLIREHTRVWREQSERLILIRRMQRLDDMRECLAEGSRSASALATECGIRPIVVLELLRLLMATGEVVRMGTGSRTTYSLASEGNS